MFEGVMDFLSALVLGLAGKEDCLVLNSVSIWKGRMPCWTATGKSGATWTGMLPGSQR